MSTPGVTTEESARLNGLRLIAERTGLWRAGAVMEAALSAYDEALTSRREVDAVVAEARAEHDEAVALAELAAAGRITRETNRTFVPAPDSDGARRQVTAAEARTWLDRAVADDPAVADAAAVLAKAVLAQDEAKDRIAVAERRIQMTKYSTEAAVSLTNLLAHAFEGSTK